MNQATSCNPCVTTKKPQPLACYNNESGTGHKVSICIEIITDPMKAYQAREVPLNLIPALPALHSFQNALPPTAINREDKSIVPTTGLRGFADARLRPQREDKRLFGAKNQDNMFHSMYRFSCWACSCVKDCKVMVAQEWWFFFSFLDNKRNCVLDENVIAIRIQLIDSHIVPPMRMHQSLMSSLAGGEKENCPSS